MYSLILHGKGFVDLQKWRNFRVSVKLGENAFSFCDSFSSASASADTSPKDCEKGKSFTLSYLVKSLGLATKLAESVSRKVSFEDKGNPDSVLNLLRSHGFTDSQISNIVRTYPGLLIADAEKSLGSKLKFLLSRGASTSELIEILSKVPEILGKSRSISVYYGFIKEIIEADKCSKFKKFCDSLPECSKQGNKIRNILVLRELGMPQKLLFRLLISNSQPVCGKEKFEESLKKVVEMGFDSTTPKFVKALQVFYQMSDKTIEEKVDVFKRVGFTVGEIWETVKIWPVVLTHSKKKILDSVETFLGLGFSRDEVLIMVKRLPSCLTLSSETVKRKTEFVVKKMNWPLKAVVSHPHVLGFSMEKRIVPRCNVIKALMSKGLLGSELPPMSSVLMIPDQGFLNKYVMKHDDKKLVPELMAIFTRDPVIDLYKR